MPVANDRIAIGGVWAASLLCASLLLPASTAGQNERPVTEKVENHTLTTRDGVQLKITYYPSRAGKEAVPVVLLHDHKGSRHELNEYAIFLQQAGLAVIAPDLRGHGESTQQQLPGGATRELDAARLRRVDFANMELDMEAVRKFLLRQNNESKLNLNKLVLVGAGMGATVALNWTAKDWSMPDLTTGKQGRDVKALALVSPQWSFSGVSINQAINHPLVRSQISLLIAYGERDSGTKRDADRIYKIAERHHPPFDPTQGRDKQELFLMPRPTNRQGGELFPADIDVGHAVLEFIQNRAVKQDFPWSERRGD